MSKINTIYGSALACAIYGLSVPGVAVAQQGGDGKPDFQLEEIIVTARRTEESLQDVPTSVSAISKDDLAALRIDSFQTVGQTVPNVYIQKQGGSPAAPQMQIRGISNGSLNLQVDSGIGLYIDGVYLGRPGAAAFDVADLEQVEVLRGPQGTLFGRNSTGGAINLITAKPTGELGGSLTLGVGNFDQQTVRGSLNLPSIAGLSAKLNILSKEIEGDVDNIAAKRTYTFSEPFGSFTTADRGGDDDTEAFSVSLRYDGIDGLLVDYRYDDTDWTGTKNIRQIANVPAGSFFPDGGVFTETVSVRQNGFDYVDKLNSPLEGESTLETDGHTLTVEYEMTESLTAKYIFSDRGYELDAGGNQVWGAHEATVSFAFSPSVTVGDDFTPLFALRLEEQDQTSHEFQFIGSMESLDWIVGAFIFEEEGSVNNPIGLFRTWSTTAVNTFSAAAGDYYVGQHTEVENESEAIYGHITYHLDNIDIGAGIRYTEDTRKERVIAGGVIGTPQAVIDANTPSFPAGTFPALPGDLRFRTENDNIDFDLSITYNINEDMNVFYKYATGYVSGGTLMGSAFENEEVESHEIGVKSDLLDNRLRVNAAVFHMEREDTQIEGFTSIGYFMGRGEEQDSTGFELEVVYLPFEGMTVDFNYGFTDVDSSGQLRTFQPEQTAYLGLAYDFSTMAEYAPSVRLDVSWRDDVHRLACPAGTDQVPASDSCVGTINPVLDAQAELPATTHVGAVIRFDEIELGGDVMGAVSLWGKNLLDEDNPEYSFTLGDDVLTQTFIRPRTYGVDFTVEF